MKKEGILNAELARVVAALGHTDALVIGDAGLPAPPGVAVIDLAVTRGLPSFWPVLDAVLSEMVVERAVVAEEAGPEVRAGFAQRLTSETVPHAELKALSARAVCLVRTGEVVPYTNVILWSGTGF